jgi:hypothetical protein
VGRLFHAYFESQPFVFQLLRSVKNRSAAKKARENKAFFNRDWFESRLCETIETQDRETEMALKQCCLRQSG